jgi:hypothetical protein
MSRGHAGGWTCFALAVLLLAVAVRNAYRIAEPAIRWQSVLATVETPSIRSKHDGEGLLVFQAYARLTYSAAGQAVVTDAPSSLATRDFARAREALKRLEKSSTVPVYWNPADPKQVKFAIAYGDLAGAEVAGAALAAILFALGGLWSRKYWLPPMLCVRCRMRVDRYFRFCPHCRTLLQEQPGP